MKQTEQKSRFAFTLLETLVVIMLSAMILTVVLGIYTRVRASAAVILDQLGSDRLQDEILQKIAEDIDRLAAPGFDAVINFANKATTNNFRSARLILTNSYYGNNNRKETYEEVIWQTWFDPDAGSMVLYRMHTGINVEDEMLQGNAEEYLSPEGTGGKYVPVAEGVTFFELRVQKGETILSSWQSETLPNAVQVGISFAPRQQLDDGSIGVPDNQITYRTIAVDRTRLIPYQFIKKELDLSVLDEDMDPNDLASGLNDSDKEDPDETERDEEMGDPNIYEE